MRGASERMGDETLYARLLGPAWFELPRCVQDFHQTLTPVRGRFEVRHGGPVAVLLARLLKLPRASASVGLTLTVERCGQKEKWVRHFGNDTITTIQWTRGDRLLRERFGIIELGFELRIGTGGLTYQQCEAALRIWHSSLRIPQWLAPRVSAVERVCANSEDVEVSVEVSLPAVGLLIAYDGVVYGGTEVRR